MATVEPLGPGRIEPRELEQEMRSSFLDYAMSVIVARALPDVRDGLKPVHRRVLYAMHEAGLQPNRPRLKCARVVGDVMGNYHPHGDQAIYDTLVRLAQPFSLRYPLVDGQGNFGNIDDYPAAAMRYTECRLTRLATEMLRDIDADTVDFKPNYDESRREPDGPAVPLPEPARQRLGRDRGRHGDEHPAAQPRRGRRRDRGDDRRADDRRRPADEAHQGPGLPDRRDHPRPRAGSARPTARAAAGSSCGRAPTSRSCAAARRRSSSASCRTASRRAATSGVIKKIADLVNDKVITEVSDVEGPLRQVRHAHPDRAQARRDPAGRPEQALQAHVAADDLRLQRRRARRRRAADALAARPASALPRLPARGRHPPLEVRAAQGRGPRARPRRATSSRSTTSTRSSR